MDRTITAWEASNGRASLGKKTATSLERMLGDLQDRLNDINETWKETENNNEGNKTTRSPLLRTVRSVAGSTASAFRQIEEFQQEWQARTVREKQSAEWTKSKDDPHDWPRQITERSASASALPSHNNNNNIFHRRLCQARMFPTSPSRQGGERYHPTAICTEVLT